MSLRILLVTFLILLHVGVVGAQPPHVVAFYNVENLMDVEDDPLTADEDMLPLADREWSEQRLRTKLQSIAGVISSLEMPILLGLAEVENGRVLNLLVGQKELVSAGYRVCHYDSADRRGIDVALLYRPDCFTLQRSLAVKAEVGFPTRDMLAVWGRLCGVEVVVVVVHLPSRIGGEKFTESRRMTCQRQLRGVIDSIRRAEPCRRVIVMGDMNDNPRNKSIREGLGAVALGHKAGVGCLYNPFSGVRWRASRGSSVYGGEWNLYDNIILSSEFLSGGELQLVGRGRIFKAKHLLDSRGHPLPTYRGVEYMGGVSDHLPVYVYLQ